MQPKRRLPVLPSGEPTDDAPRPGWQWVAFGTLAIVVVFLPLSAFASLAGPTIAGVASASAAGLALSALAGGFLLGRWGSRGVGVRQAALAGLAAAMLAVGLSWATLPFSFGQALAAGACLAAIAVPAAALGGKLGLRRRAGGHAT